MLHACCMRRGCIILGRQVPRSLLACFVYRPDHTPRLLPSARWFLGQCHTIETKLCKPGGRGRLAGRRGRQSDVALHHATLLHCGVSWYCAILLLME